MGIAVDIFLVVILCAAVIGGTVKGFIRSIMNLLTFFAAFVCAWVFTPSLSAYFLDTVFMSKITGTVSSAVEGIIGSGIGGISIDSLFADMPDAFTSILERFGADIPSLEQFYSQQTADGASDITERVSDYIAQPVASLISTVAAYLAIFIGVMLLLKIVALILDIVFKLPGLSAINRIGGFLFGCVVGLLYVFVFAAVISAGWPALCAMFPAVCEPGALDNSLLLGLANKYNVFTMINFDFLGV